MRSGPNRISLSRFQPGRSVEVQLHATSVHYALEEPEG